MICKNIIKSFFSLLLPFLISACGGNGGDGEVTPDVQPEARPVIELLPNARIETPVDITSDENNLYLSSYAGLIEVSKSTWNKRTLVGNTLVATPSGGNAIAIPSQNGLKVVNSYIYSGYRKISRTYVGSDAFGAVSILLPQHMIEGCCNFDGITGNSTTLFYHISNGSTSSDIYSIDLNGVGASTFVASYPGVIEVLATENYLYVRHITDNTNYAITRHNLGTGQDSVLQTSLPTAPYSEPRQMAVNSANVFWMNGDTVYSTDLDSDTPFVVATNTPSAPFMEASTQHLYILEPSRVVPSPGSKVLQIEIGTGTVIDMNTGGLDFSDITYHNGSLYAVNSYPIGPTITVRRIYKLDATIAPALLFDSNGTNLPQGIGSSKIVGSGDYLFVSNGLSEIIKYTISNGNYEFLYPYTKPQYIHSDNGTIALGHRFGDPGISTFEDSQDIRQPTTLFEWPIQNQLMNFLNSYIDNGYIYWTWKLTDGPYVTIDYRLSKMMLDGSNYEELFVTTEELRDITVKDGLIYFTCLNDCGSPGWVLASLPTQGGTPNAEFGLLASPTMYFINDTFYIVDTVDFKSMSLFAINISLDTSIELVTDLYDGGVYIEVSTEWLYVGESLVGSLLPKKRLRRFPLMTWDRIGKGETIIDAGESDIEFSPWTMHTDDRHLYFWDSALKRVAE